MKKISLLIITALMFWGCSTFSRNYTLGTEAAMSKNWDEAIKFYERAVWENPKNSVYRLALLRAKIAASYHHLQKGRKLVAMGMREEALAEYEKALSYDPFNRIVIEEAKLIKEGEKKEEKPKKEGIEPPVVLKVSKERVKLRFVETNLRSIYQALGKFAQVNILFDEQFKDTSFSINLTDMNFEEAISALSLASKNFYRIIDEQTIIVAPDTPMKRAQYDLNAIRTFYLSNIKAQEVQGLLALMLRSQYRAPSIIVDKNLNSITLRDTPSNIELAEKLLKLWDKSKGEVVIDLEIMVVSRVKLRQVGLDFDQRMIGVRYGGADSSKDSETSGWYNLKDIDFSKAENFQISLPISYIRFLESDSDTKVIAQPRLRGVDGEEIKLLVGQKIPIPRTTFTPIAAGGVSQQPVTSFEYQDVGIDIKIKPKIHFEKEITLDLELKITSLGGTGYADIPIISTREVKNTIRLKDGETNLLAGLLRDEERKSLKGIAFLKNIPLLGSLFSSSDQTITQTDVILVITPYIIRSLALDEKDMEPLWIGLKGVSSLRRGEQRLPQEELFERRLRRERKMADTDKPEEARVENQMFLNPSNFQIPQNREFRINLNMRSQEEIGNLSLNVNFNNQILKLKEVSAGAVLSRLGKKVPFLKNIDNASGTCTIGFSSPDIGKGIKGAGRIATLVFQAVKKGEGIISISSLTANSPKGTLVSFKTNVSNIVVR